MGMTEADVALIVLDTMTQCAVAIKQEIKHATLKHGILRNPDRSIAILTEEVGEAAHEVIELKEPGARERAFHELMQVASTAMRLAVQIKEDTWRETK